LDQYDVLHKQLLAAPADQKGPIQDQINQGNQTAISELTLAEQGVQAKDVKNHAIVWASLAQAYDHAERYDDSVAAYQKAIDLAPSPSYYLNMSTAQARVAAAQTDPAAVTAKMVDAGSDCDKAAALDPTTASKCWKNIGIILSNKGDLKDAIPPLQKATEADAKDAQAWYLLGSAYTGTIDSKQVGDKMVYVIPPGTADAYQKCVDADPNGPYAAQAKAMLDSLVAMGGGEDTSVGVRDKSKTKKK
jgi:tetratricopeptide (TPR) repeat protein